LTEFVKAEFEAFLERGILAHGFLRLRCAECAHEKLVAFSCNRRGLCPSCGAPRMAESAAHVRDRPLDYRAVIATAPIEVTVELP
jgi:ribosomal protein S27E